MVTRMCIKMKLFLVRNIIKLFNIFFLFSASILLTGCWDRREVNDIAIVLGAAIFKQNKMIGQIDAKITRGLLWLQEEAEVNAITINFQKGETISLEPLQQKTELFPVIENGKWKILVKIELEGSVIQNGSTLEVKKPNITKKLEENVEKKVKQLINTTLNQVQVGLNADAFGFADAFHRKSPKEWGKVKNQWDKVLSQVDVKIDVKARISRTGLSSAPTGLK